MYYIKIGGKIATVPPWKQHTNSPNVFLLSFKAGGRGGERGWAYKTIQIDIK